MGSSRRSGPRPRACGAPSRSSEEVRELGLDIRAGLHIGEAELAGEKVGGIAVTTAQRVASAAGPGQVFATDTIVHLVAGSGLEFTDLGSRELKGVPGRWELFSLDAVDAEPIGTRLDPKDAVAARDRSSPPQTPKAPSLRVVPLGIGAILVALLAGGILLFRGHTGQTVVPSTVGPTPAALVALTDASGEVAFPVDLAPLPRNAYAGPIVLTGRVDTPTAFSWVPVGSTAWNLPVAQVNRNDGAVVDPALTFNTNRTTCVCVALAADRRWTPIATGKFPGDPSRPPGSPGRTGGTGTSVRGISLEGASGNDVVVDDALESGGVTALVSGGGYLWLGDSAKHRVYRIDPKSTKVKKISLRQSADVLVFADGSLWVLDTSGGKITRVDPRTAHPYSSLPIAGDLQSMAVGGGYAWVTDASGNVVDRVPEDLRSAAMEIPVGAVGGPPSAVAYDHGAIVVGFDRGTVAKIDPADPTSPAVIWMRQVGNSVSAITIDHGVVWAAGGQLSNY